MTMKTVPLVIYPNGTAGSRVVIGSADVDLINGGFNVRLDNEFWTDEDARTAIIKHGDFSIGINLLENLPEEVVYLPQPYLPKNTDWPHSKLIHPSHVMARFSDVPWGCRQCGACECHHLPILCMPCIDPYSFKKLTGEENGS